MTNKKYDVQKLREELEESLKYRLSKLEEAVLNVGVTEVILRANDYKITRMQMKEIMGDLTKHDIKYKQIVEKFNKITGQVDI